MKLENDKYSITISVDDTYTADSADNRHYDVILNPLSYMQHDYYKALSVVVNNGIDEYSIVLIGSYYSYDSDCAILEDDTLIVLQDKYITQLNLSDGSILRKLQIPNSFGLHYAIYKTSLGYVIYGEVEIIGLDLQFNEVWRFTEGDAFISFKIMDDRLIITDYENNTYELSLEGTLIKEIHS